MIRTTALFLTTAVLSSPAFAASHASGDAEAGESAFRQCQSCHVVASPDGETLAGRSAKTGPNLYGIAGRAAGTVEDFRYGDDLVKAGEMGLTWDEEKFVAYVQDPKGYLQEFLDDSGARSKMSFRVRKEEDAVNLYAFLAQFGGEEAMMEEVESEGESN